MFDMIEYVLKEFETLDFWRFSVILSGYYFFVEYCVVIRSCPFVFEFFFLNLACMCGVSMCVSGCRRTE